MPNRAVHNRFAEFFGVDPELADIVNKKMDEPSKWLGPTHRRVRHDIPYAVKMALEVSQEQNLKRKIKRQILPAEVMKAYGVHVVLDTVSLNPAMRRMFRLMEALSD